MLKYNIKIKISFKLNIYRPKYLIFSYGELKNASSDVEKNV